MSANVSLAASLASLHPSQWTKILADLDEAELEAFEHDWQSWARPEQLAPPGSWRVWLLLAGRGFGKTRSGAEWIRSQVASGYRRIALVAPTAGGAAADGLPVAGSDLRVVVAIDPAVTSGEDADETGIIESGEIVPRARVRACVRAS
jgi:phage terminase large subunit-like protein